MNHLNCIISDHEDDNSSVECLSKWLATAAIYIVLSSL